MNPPIRLILVLLIVGGVGFAIYNQILMNKVIDEFVQTTKSILRAASQSSPQGIDLNTSPDKIITRDKYEYFGHITARDDEAMTINSRGKIYTIKYEDISTINEDLENNLDQFPGERTQVLAMAYAILGSDLRNYLITLIYPSHFIVFLTLTMPILIAKWAL